MFNVRRPNTQQQAWTIVRDPHNQTFRKECWELLQTLYPEGNGESLRFFAEHMQRESYRHKTLRHRKMQYLREIHPRAYGLLARYGRAHRPYTWPEPPAFGEPRARRCTENAHLLMSVYNDDRSHEKERLVYVEGITAGSLTYPMLHAWVAKGLEGHTAIDWTLYAVSPWNRYLGIVVTEVEYMLLQDILSPGKPRTSSLLHRNNFPRIQKELRSILVSRM